MRAGRRRELQAVPDTGVGRFSTRDDRAAQLRPTWSCGACCNWSGGGAAGSRHRRTGEGEGAAGEGGGSAEAAGVAGLRGNNRLGFGHTSETARGEMNLYGRAPPPSLKAMILRPRQPVRSLLWSDICLLIRLCLAPYGVRPCVAASERTGDIGKGVSEIRRYWQRCGSNGPS